MAEQVQVALDNMVAPLRDLLERGIFSQPEIQAIVQRRRESEYLLRRRVARKADFLRYIEAEMQLEKLRKLRMKKLSNRKHRKNEEIEKNNNNNKAAKKSGGLPIGDVHVVQLIHLLFQRTLRKFKSDISIHLQYAEFAKEAKSYNRLGRVYTEALQIHPRNIGLWIEAASFEFFGHDGQGGGGSIQSARILLQRGIRINKASQMLWVQYFTLELHNLQKLRGRREILQITETEEGDPLFTEPPVLKIIFNNAIKTIPDDVGFRMKFLDACSMFPQTTKIEAMIQETIERDFQNNPEAWIARAMYMASKQSEDQEESIGFLKVAAETEDFDEQMGKRQRTSDPVLRILDEAVENIPTAEMYVQVIRFATEYAERLKNTGEATKLIEHTLERASELHDTGLALEHSSYLISNGELNQAMDILMQYYLREPTNVPILLRLSYLLASTGDLAKAAEKLESALPKIPIYDSDYTKVQLELFGVLLANDTPETSEKLSGIFEKILLLTPQEPVSHEPIFGVGSVAQACVAYLRYQDEHRINTTETINRMLERSRFLESPTKKSDQDLGIITELFELALELMEKTDSENPKRKKANVKRLYKRAIEFFNDCAPSVAESFRNQRNEKLLFN